jgi:hypothetical protein
MVKKKENRIRSLVPAVLGCSSVQLSILTGNANLQIYLVRYFLVLNFCGAVF